MSELPFAEVDHDRARRCGFPEVVLCEGKTPEQAAAIARAILTAAPRVLLTRAGYEHAEAVQKAIAGAIWHPVARCITVDPTPLQRRGLVAIVSGGTSDLPVVEEARVTLEILGAATECHVDVGIAGLHRVLSRVEQLRRANALVVVAGMEGALPSVVAGLVDRPVIAVPTSVGYGASFGGIAALLAMLNSCATGIGVVNIDNGFGAAYLAARINALATGATAQ